VKRIPFLLSVLFVPLVAVAAPRESDQSRSMIEDVDGVLAQNEYRRISEDGSITSRQCPYTCKMRGVARKNCREWHSAMYPDRCYVQDMAASTPQTFDRYFTKRDEEPRSRG